MKKYMLCERANHYHEVEVDDEVDIEGVLDKAFEEKDRYNTGYESIEDTLLQLRKMFGFGFKLSPNACGTETIGFDIIDELD